MQDGKLIYENKLSCEKDVENHRPPMSAANLDCRLNIFRKMHIQPAHRPQSFRHDAYQKSIGSSMI